MEPELKTAGCLAGKKIKKFFEPRLAHTAVIIDHFIVVFGGLNSQQGTLLTNDLYVLSLKSELGRIIPNVPGSQNPPTQAEEVKIHWKRRLKLEKEEKLKQKKEKQEQTELQPEQKQASSESKKLSERSKSASQTSKPPVAVPPTTISIPGKAVCQIFAPQAKATAVAEPKH